MLLGGLPREQLDKRPERGVPRRRGVGLTMPARPGAAPTGRLLAVVGPLGGRGWIVVGEVDHLRARLRVIDAYVTIGAAGEQRRSRLGSPVSHNL